MSNRRLSDQVLILEGIADIRQELKVAKDAGESNKVIWPILTRLVCMYSLIHTDQLIRATKLTDLRDQYERKVA